jgi:osmotically inducible protein OsmC
MATTRRAEVSWQGDLMSGTGKVTAASSGRFDELPVSWARRTEQPEGWTSPEELLAAAHASCFAMALAGGLTRAGTPPERLEVAATVTFDRVDGGWRVTSSSLEVRGRLPGGGDADAFRRAAEAAKDGCPISQALKGNVALSVSATLDA